MFYQKRKNLPILKKASLEFIVSELTLKNARKFAEKADSILIGPGLDANNEDKKIINYLLKNFRHKNSFWMLPHFALLTKNCCPRIVSLLRMLQNLKKCLKQKQLQKCQEICQKYNCIIVLKSNINIISDGKSIYHNLTGNAGLTTGGTGDVGGGRAASGAAVKDAGSGPARLA